MIWQCLKLSDLTNKVLEILILYRTPVDLRHYPKNHAPIKLYSVERIPDDRSKIRYIICKLSQE